MTTTPAANCKRHKSWLALLRHMNGPQRTRMTVGGRRTRGRRNGPNMEMSCSQETKAHTQGNGNGQKQQEQQQQRPPATALWPPATGETVASHATLRVCSTFNDDPVIAVAFIPCKCSICCPFYRAKVGFYESEAETGSSLSIPILPIAHLSINCYGLALSVSDSFSISIFYCIPPLLLYFNFHCRLSVLFARASHDNFAALFTRVASG